MRALGGKSFRIAFRCATIHPVLDQPEFFLRQGLFVAKRAEALDGAPRRHGTPQHAVSDRLRPGIGVLKGQERKGAASRLMALRAPRVNDARDLAIPGHLCRDVMPGQRDGATSGYGYRAGQTHQGAASHGVGYTLTPLILI